MIRTVFCLGVALAFSTGACAQDYPTKPIRFIVPNPAGGGNDVIARIIATELGVRLGKQVVVDNRGGAAGVIGTEAVATAAGDGYTLLVASSNHVSNPWLYKINFDPVKSFAPVAMLATVPAALVVHPGVPAKSVQEFIALAKTKPGKLNYGSSGIGATPHLSGELFKRMAGVDIVVVHYRGGAPAMNDLLSGHIDMIFSNIPDAIGQVRGGAVRALGISTLKRSTIEPEFPTIADTVPGYDTTSWIGVGARAGTPMAICDAIEAGTRAICQDPILKARLADLVSEPVGSSAAEFTAYVAAERAQWGKLIGDLKIRGE